MPDVDERYDSAKALASYCKVAGIALGTLVPPAYGYHNIKRLVTIDEEGALEARSDDPLAALLVEASRDALSSTVQEGRIEIDIDPSASLAALFAGSFGKGLKPKLHACTHEGGKVATAELN